MPLDAAPAAPGGPTARLPRETPSAHGVDARGVLAFLDSVEHGGPELHSLMVVRDGSVVAEGWWSPYRADLPHELYSVTKVLAATAFGFARADGLLDLDDLVLDHLRDLAPARPDPRQERLRLRHLLTMTSGHGAGVHAGLFELGDWDRGALALPFDHEPGTAFGYSSACTYLLGVVVERVTGRRLLDHLTPRLLEPLGITGRRWDRSPSGHDNGGFGYRATTEDLACLGQTYLDGGRWRGQQVLPPGWAQEATAFQVPSRTDSGDWAQGYGYGFWRCRPDGVVRADGAFGQYAILFPRQRAVVALTSGTSDLQGVLDRVWEHLLPALGRGPDVRADEELARRLAALRLPVPEPVPVPAPAGRRVRLEPNPLGVTEVTVTAVGPDGAVRRLELHRPGGRASLDVGDGGWADGGLPGPDGVEPVAVAGAWTSPTAHETHVRWLEQATGVRVRTEVDGDAVRCTARFTVRFHDDPEPPSVTGRVVATTED